MSTGPPALKSRVERLRPSSKVSKRRVITCIRLPDKTLRTAKGSRRNQVGRWGPSFSHASSPPCVLDVPHQPSCFLARCFFACIFSGSPFFHWMFVAVPIQSGLPTSRLRHHNVGAFQRALCPVRPSRSCWLGPHRPPRSLRSVPFGKERCFLC